MSRAIQARDMEGNVTCFCFGSWWLTGLVNEDPKAEQVGMIVLGGRSGERHIHGQWHVQEHKGLVILPYEWSSWEAPDIQMPSRDQQLLHPRVC